MSMPSTGYGSGALKECSALLPLCPQSTNVNARPKVREIEHVHILIAHSAFPDTLDTERAADSVLMYLVTQDPGFERAGPSFSSAVAVFGFLLMYINISASMFALP